jgi:hypothetical protein
MKMGFFSAGMAFGLLFILIGISIILKLIFKVNIPVVRIAFALFIIYLGFHILFGSFSIKHRTVYFAENNITAVSGENEYSIIFGKGEIDLTGLDESAYGKEYETNVVFGEGLLKINSLVPFKVKSEYVFSGLRLPDKEFGGIGSFTYTSKAYKEGEPFILVKADAVFASLVIIEK